MKKKENRLLKGQEGKERERETPCPPYEGIDDLSGV